MYDLIPSAFYLSQNYPNPFKDKTTIKYCVAYETKVKITVFNSNGVMIKTLVYEEKGPGTYEVEFSSCHSHECGNPKGATFYYRFEAGDYSNQKCMTLKK